MERQIPVRELNQNTSGVLQKVAQGTAVTITRDGKPIARLVPITGTSEGLDRLVASGQAVAPTAPGSVTLPPKYGEDPDVAGRLTSDREEERT